MRNLTLFTTLIFFPCSHVVSSDSSFNVYNALYFVKYPSRAAQNSPEGSSWHAGRGLKTPALQPLNARLYIKYQD